MLKHLFGLVFSACLVALAVVFVTTKPSTAGLGIVLFVFFAVFVSLSGCFFLFIKSIYSLSRKVKTNRVNLSDLKALNVSLVLAFGAVTLLAMSTLNRLSLFDLAMVVFLVFVAILYVLKRY